MRRLVLFIAIALSALAATPTAATPPPPATPTTTTATPTYTKAELERIYWWHYELNKQARFRADMDRLAAWLRAQAAERIACDGDTVPCWVVRRESGFDPRIWNGRCYAPTGWRGPRAPNCPRAESSASGYAQVVRGTWAGYGGYLNAADAPVSVQNARVRQLWDRGRGCGHWSACRRR